MKFSVLAGGFFLVAIFAHATVDDSLSLAYELASPYVKQSFTLRQDKWGGDLGVDEKKGVTAQFYKGNEYLFFLASDTSGAQLSVNIYNSEGNLANSESWQRDSTAAARIVCKQTGLYYIVIHVLRSPEERTSWALVYGYK